MDKDMNPILNKNNYKYWKRMTEVSMVSLGLWDAVDPGLTAVERTRSEYVKLDNMARAYIFRHVRPEYLVDIKRLKTAKECWKALEEILWKIHIDGHRLVRAGTGHYRKDSQHGYPRVL